MTFQDWDFPEDLLLIRLKNPTSVGGSIVAGHGVLGGIAAGGAGTGDQSNCV